MTSLFTTKFVRLLQTFDVSEMRAFEDWLNSPWCNSNRNIVQIFFHLKSYYPTFNKRLLSKEALFRLVLPKGKFSERRMNNLLSEASQTVEKFLVFQRLSHNEGMQYDLLMREFQERAFDDWFFKESVQEINRLKDKKVPEWEDRFYLFRLHKRVYHHPTETKIGDIRAALEQMNEQLDLLYLLEKADVINEMIFRNRLSKERYPATEEVLKKWEIIGKGIKHPAIDLYRMRFVYSREREMEQYWALRKAYEEGFHALNTHEQKAHLISLLNDTMVLIKSGKMDIGDILPLYRLGLESGTLFNQGKLTVNTYTAIVSASNTKGDFEFTKYFVENYSENLHLKVRNDGIIWAKAHTAYRRKELEEGRKILKGYEFKTLHFQLVSRVLNTQIYFDLMIQDMSYQMFLFSFMESFERWLLRQDTLSKDLSDSFVRFIQICRTLSRYYTRASQKLKLKRLHTTRANIQAINWLLQKESEVIHLVDQHKRKPR